MALQLRTCILTSVHSSCCSGYFRHFVGNKPPVRSCSLYPHPFTPARGVLSALVLAATCPDTTNPTRRWAIRNVFRNGPTKIYLEENATSGEVEGIVRMPPDWLPFSRA